MLCWQGDRRLRPLQLYRPALDQPQTWFGSRFDKRRSACCRAWDMDYAARHQGWGLAAMATYWWPLAAVDGRAGSRWGYPGAVGRSVCQIPFTGVKRAAEGVARRRHGSAGRDSCRQRGRTPIGDECRGIYRQETCGQLKGQRGQTTGVVETGCETCRTAS